MKTVTFADPVLQALAERVVAQHGQLPVIAAQPPEKYFHSLSESIVSQQLSTKVADTIMARVVELVGADLTPLAVLEKTVEQLRQVGLSYAKASYLQNLATAWQQGLIVPQQYPDFGDEEIILDLIKVKGIGRWTAEMFLIFTMGRSDVFSVGDFALRKAVMRAYELPPVTKVEQILALAEQWQPQRSLASRVLWKSLELK